MDWIRFDWVGGVTVTPLLISDCCSTVDAVFFQTMIYEFDYPGYTTIKTQHCNSQCTQFTTSIYTRYLWIIANALVLAAFANSIVQSRTSVHIC